MILIYNEEIIEVESILTVQVESGSLFDSITITIEAKSENV